MSNEWYPVSALTGGGAGALDAIDGSTISAGDRAIYSGSEGSGFYIAEDPIGDTENSPLVIIPDTNPGTLGWRQVEFYGRLTVPIKKDLFPGVVIDYPDIASLPSYYYQMGPSMQWEGGEEKYGKWRQYFNCYESGWMLTYNCRYNTADNTWGPRDVDSAEGSICAMMRFNTAEGISGRNVFEIKFEKIVTDAVGTATSGSDFTLVDSTASWGTNLFNNHYVFILDGAGGDVVESQEISSHTSTVITVPKRWDTNPVSGTHYSIGPHPGWLTAGHYIFYDGCPSYMRNAPTEFKIASPGALDTCLKLSTSETVSPKAINIKNYYADTRLRIEKVTAITLSPAFSETVTKYLTIMTEDDGSSLEGFVGIGTDDPLCPLHARQDDTAGGMAAARFHQEDVSEGVIEFTGATGVDRGSITGATNSTESVRVELNGTVYRLALYADA